MIVWTIGDVERVETRGTGKGTGLMSFMSNVCRDGTPYSCVTVVCTIQDGATSL